MKLRSATFLSILAAILIAAPVFAQTKQGFFDDMRANLGSTSTEEAPIVVGSPTKEPSASARQAIPLGTTENGTSTPAAAQASDVNAYVAGTDIWSGPIAGIAAVLSVVLIGLVLWLLLGHRHAASHES